MSDQYSFRPSAGRQWSQMGPKIVWALFTILCDVDSLEVLLVAFSFSHVRLPHRIPGLNLLKFIKFINNSEF